jgi:peroxiredoxin Q/BCP
MSLLSVGAPFPAFDLRDQHGARHTQAELAEGTSVVYFYPKDETPGCTRQACELRDSQADFDKRGIKVLGVSADDTQSHAAFAAQHQLGFTLLADVDHALCDAVGVWGLQTWGEHTWQGIARTTFVVIDGCVAAVLDQVVVAEHVGKTINTINTLGA